MPSAVGRFLCGLVMAAGLAAMSPASAQVSRPDVGANDLSILSWRDMPFRTVVRQQYDYSCGSAALATLLRYHYGLDVSEAQIFRAMWEHGDKAKIAKVGFSLLDMKTYVVGRGFTADGYRGDVRLLEELDTPAVAVVTIGPYRHFVIVKGVRVGQVLVGDPALGLKVYSTADFLKMWNGIVLVVRSERPTKVVFNDPREWRPVAPAPAEEAARGRDLQFLSEFPPIYQIVQLRPF